MILHVASREGVTINFDFPAGGGGSCLNCYNKIICVLLINLLYLVRQGIKFHSFYFCNAKVILFWCFYLYNCYIHADFDRKLINQAFR